MKRKKLHLWILLALFSLGLAACQPTVEETPTQEAAANETAYPVETQEITRDTPDANLAYPVTEEDLEMLYRTWELTAYSEDGVAMEPPAKTLRFGADGTYEITSEEGTSTGTWTARLFSIESTLYLTEDTGDAFTLEIIDLEESLLNLRYWRGNTQIDEQYEPAE